MSDTTMMITEARDALVEKAWEYDEMLVRAMILSSTDDWIELDLTMAQLKTMVAIKSEGSATIGRVAEILGVGVPTSSHLVNRLVQSGLAQRVEDPTDRRRTAVSLTHQGTELIKRLRQGKRSLLRRWMMQMDETDLAALVQGLSALVAVMQEENT